MKIKNIKIQNFAGIRSLESDLADATIISGRNRSGKTSIKNAIMWVLYDKLADGSSADGIRPHDATGKDIDMTDIDVELTIDCDGVTYVLHKTQKQKWVAKRGEAEKTFQGNENIYEINGVPKKLKDYQEFIGAIVDLETLIFGTNPMAFLSLDTKKRREKLLSLDEGFTDADVVATDDRFKELEADLSVATVDELIARERKAIKVKNDEIKEIPSRVDELNNSKSNRDVAELELQRNGIKEEIKAAEDAIEESKNVGRANLASKLVEAQFKKTDLEKAEYSKVQAKITEVSAKINDTNGTIYKYNRANDAAHSELESTKQKIKTYQAELKDLGELYKKTKESTYTGSNTCPTCGQELPAEKVEQAVHAFEVHKAEEMKRFVDKGNTLKGQIETLEARTAELEKQMSETSALVAIAEKELKTLKAQIEKIKGEAVPAPKSKEYKAVLAEIEDLQNQIKECATEENPNDLEAHLKELKVQLTEVEHLIALANNDIKIDERIEALRQSQVALAQEATDHERILDLLNEYNRAKIKMLTDRVNKFFSIIEWKMFETQINGGTAECCKAMVNGTSYDGLLNHGDKILAEIDICQAFQKSKGVQLPIIVDDTESVDPERVPTLDTQIICLRRTDNDLKIAEV